MNTPTLTPSATRRAVLAAFCLTGLLMSPGLMAAQGKSAPGAADELSPAQLEQRIAAMEQERIALLTQIRDDDKTLSATPGVSLLMTLAALTGVAGTAATLYLLTRRQKSRRVKVDDWERCVVLSGEHDAPPASKGGNPGQARPTCVRTDMGGSRTFAPMAADSIEYDPVASDSIRYEVRKLSQAAVKTVKPTATTRSATTATTPASAVEVAVLMRNRFDPGAATLQVSECVDPLPQAQFWAAMCQPSVVIEILEPVVEKQTTPHGWLLLLEMYTLTERRSQYEALKQRFKALFNAMVPAFDDYAASLKQRRLRDCPDLAQRIDRMLGNGSVVTYLRNLLLDDRKGERRGFEMGVYCDLVRLHDTVSAGKSIKTCEEIGA